MTRLRKAEGTDRLIEFAKAHGCTVGRTRGGHIKIKREGMRTVFFSLTPSDHRAWRNCLSQLRRELHAAGVETCDRNTL